MPSLYPQYFKSSLWFFMTKLFHMGCRDFDVLPMSVSSASFAIRFPYIRVSQHRHYWLVRLDNSVGLPRILRSIPGLYPLDSTRSQLWQPKISPACLMSLGLGEIPLVGNYRSRPFFPRYLFIQMYHASSHYKTSEIITSFLWNNLPLPAPMPNY